ncbi:class I SAM-dependent methyltransferase [Catellatospora citrea]|uniref:SAM-dependent methyltransferase n=1 Tax=Catellatospora citrea TaxID=53366 RepID=UPI0033C2F3AE
MMTEPTTREGRNELAARARRRLTGWARGADAITLLKAVHDRGWTTFLAQPRTEAELTGFAGVGPERVAHVVAALEAFGLTVREDGLIRLDPSVGELILDDGLYALADIVGHAATLNSALSHAVDPSGPPPLTGAQALAVAEGSVWRPGPGGRELYRKLLEAVPEFASAVRNGRLLDVGCGVAGATLTAATMLPGMRATGLELVPEVAEEARRRAAALGVDDRFQILALDVRHFHETEAFDAAFWAQPFFPSDTRAAALRSIRRALRPGGVLIVQEMEREPSDDAERPGFALRRLVFDGWGVPFARTAEELAAEAEEAGFETVRVAASQLGRIVVLRRSGQTA